MQLLKTLTSGFTVLKLKMSLTDFVTMLGTAREIPKLLETPHLKFTE